jgi:hypothetical protein
LQIPQAIFPHRLLEDGALTLLSRFDALTSAEARALVKAARVYQEALWIVEWEPERSWLLFVSAIEAIANISPSGDVDDTEMFSEAQPEIARLLKAGCGGDVLIEVARRLRPILRSTAKFINLFERYFPGAPTQRGPISLAWSFPVLKPMLMKIYSHRSKALHDGTPFPLPMCLPPTYFDGVPSDYTLGLAMSGSQGAWRAEDTPMHLHVFEYLVRESILNWWRARLADAGHASEMPETRD